MCFYKLLSEINENEGQFQGSSLDFSFQIPKVYIHPFKKKLNLLIQKHVMEEHQQKFKKS